MVNKYTVAYFLMIAVAIAVGSWLFTHKPEGKVVASGEQTLLVLESGQNAVTKEKVNYVIENQEQLAMVWKYAFGSTTEPIPAVDFTRDTVLAVFMGTQSTGGHSINIARVSDEVSKGRVITLEYTRPGTSCMVTQALESPFQFVVVAKSDLNIVREDVEKVTECK